MPDHLTTPRSFSEGACRAGLLALALCGSLALHAAAQTPAPTPGVAKSRERRAATTEEKKDAPASKGTAEKVSEPVPVEQSPAEKSDASQSSMESKGTAASKDAGASKDGTASKDGAAEVLSSPVADEDGEVEGLRARIASEKDGAERGRLRRALAERLASTGRRSEAVELLRAMLGEERFDPPYFYNTGNTLARLGESSAAIEAYRKAAGQRRGNYARAQHNLGVVLMRLGRWEEAQAALTAALKLENYAYAEASYSLGRLYALRGEAGLAIDEWARTLKIKPDHADAAIARARALAEDGDPEEALAVLDAFGERFARGGAGMPPREVSVARGEIVAARNIAYAEAGEKGARGTPSEAIASSSSTSVSAGGSRGGGGGVRASKAGALKPLSIARENYTLLRRARAARESERHEESVALYRRVIEGSGGYFPPANLELGFALASLGRNEEAVTSLRRVTEKEGDRYPIAFYHLGRYYEHLGRLAEAGAAYSRAAALLGAESPQFLLDVSRVREKEGKWAEALAATVDYVRAMEPLGATPDWARERLERLRLKAATATGEQK